MPLRPDPAARDRWARLRFAIIGPLLAAPPAAGELMPALEILAAKTWRRPDNNLDIRFGLATIERWYYRARKAKDPLLALRRLPREDRGSFPSLPVQTIECLTNQYRDHPGWTAQLHYDNLRVALGAGGALPSYPTLVRYLRARGMVRRKAPRTQTAGALQAVLRLEEREVRSFEMDHVGALWHLDFHHGSRLVLLPSGEWAKPYLLGIIDDRSRLICHLQWYLDESAHSLTHGLTQAIQKRGTPRMLLTDNGAAMLAAETTNGLARLGILHQTTLPYSPYQNAKQESFWARIESRLMAMLEGEAALTLELLNRATQAWVELDYHQANHSEIDCAPMQRFLHDPNVLRPAPDGDTLRDAFRIEVTRRQRRSDGTVSLDGVRFEVPGRFRDLASLVLRVARWDLGHVHLVCPHTGNLLCPVRPLDKSANASGERRTLPSATDPAPPTTPAGIAPLLTQLMADYAATGLPPAYIPLTQENRP